ncbi:superinfection immunity protein [Streptomyces sp. WC2508]|uniref:superinfection immunity protein n=1 Tax=unclassified Streptomyces TaxID=2593676 RepID=UPI0033D7EF16
MELFAAIPVALLILNAPSIVAYRRKVQRLRPVIVVNVIGTFTGLFWFVALFMAVSMRTHGSDPTLPADEHLAP